MYYHIKIKKSIHSLSTLVKEQKVSERYMDFFEFNFSVHSTAGGFR